MPRPSLHRIGALLALGDRTEARERLSAAVESSGSVAGAARLLGCSYRQAQRWARLLGIRSGYDGTAGGKARAAQRSATVAEHHDTNVIVDNPA